MMTNEYNFVFCNIAEDYLKPCFNPLVKYDNVRVYEHAFKGLPIMQKMLFFHWSNKINTIIRVPFKFLWFKKICTQDFNNNNPICYVFYSGKYITEDPSLYRYIKKLNPKNKCVVQYGDLISKRNIDIEKVKQCCDYVITYDRGEAQKYGIHFYDDLCYGAILEPTTPENFENDVYFLGFAKDRLNDIHNAYRRLSEAGLKCKFIICGTKEEDRIKGEGLFYQSPISYLDNIRNVINSKCVLELMQGGSDAPTLRLMEAQVYKRKLLTNNLNITNQTYYDSNNISVFHDAADLDAEFIKKAIDYSSFDVSHYDLYKRIEFLEKLLSGDERDI